MLRPHSLKTFFSAPSEKEVSSSQPCVLHPGLIRGVIRDLTSSRSLLVVLGFLLLAVGNSVLGSGSRVAHAVTSSEPGTSHHEFTQNGLLSANNNVAPSIGSTPPLLLSQSVPEIQQGDRGELVEALQERLTDLGYFNESITGYFGEITEAAVIQFQTDNGLTPDGIVGAGTTNVLRKAGPARSQRQDNPLTLEEGDQGPAVETLQNQLTSLGYYDGPITGFFGPLTETALIQFQRDKGLMADGIVGNATQSAIDSAMQSQSSSQSVQTASASTSSESALPDPNDGVWEMGEMGDSVEAIQRDLRTLGYYSRSIDGDYGSGTEEAVVEFQRSQNLTPDGKAGPVTLAALQAAINTQSTGDVATSSARSSRVSALPPSTSTQTSATVAPADPTIATGSGDVGDRTVLDIQQKLQDKGYYDGELDGDLGPATRRAIQSAQQTYGLQSSDFD